MDIIDNRKRLKITSEYDQIMEYNRWLLALPAINFNSAWNVTVIPPFMGAIVRFKINHNGNDCSIYLDGYGSLGYSDSPYWEIYPVGDDTVRCEMNDVDSLIMAIYCSLYNINLPSNEDMMIIKEWIDENDVDLSTDEGIMAFKLMWA